MKKYFSGLSKNTFLLASASLFANISTEMLYPVFPIYLTQVLKSNGSVVGIIEGVATATQNIIQGFSGWLSDSLQKRKPIALFGYTLSAVSKPLIGAAISWKGVLGARFLDRLGSGMRSAPRDALVSSSAGENNRGKAFGLEGIGVSLEGTILIYAVFNLTAAFISYPSGFLSDKFGRKNLLLVSFLISLIVYMGFAFTKSILFIAFLFVLYGVYQGTFRSVGKAYASDFVPQKLRASSIGWYSTTVGLSGLIASIIAGQLWDNINHSAVFIYGAVLAMTGTLTLLLLVPKKVNIN